MDISKNLGKTVMHKKSPHRSTATPDAAPALPGPDSILDITRETCPMTFVRTRLALDRLAPGQILRVYLHGEEPKRSVPQQVSALGHKILAQTNTEDGNLQLLLLRC